MFPLSNTPQVCTAAGSFAHSHADQRFLPTLQFLLPNFHGEVIFCLFCRSKSKTEKRKEEEKKKKKKKRWGGGGGGGGDGGLQKLDNRKAESTI